MELEVTKGGAMKFSKGTETKTYRGTGLVRGKKKITAEFEGEIVPLAEFEDADEQKRFFQLLTRESKL